MEDFSNLSVVVDGDYLAKVTGVQKRTESGQLAVDLLNEGLGGFTPGSGRVRITISYSVPIGGAEFDFATAVAEGEYHTVQVPVGSKTYVGLGKFIDDDLGQSTNSSTEGSVSWEGELKKMQ